ncbi:hypothetical protein DRQ05_06115, partial [bacterium]
FDQIQKFIQSADDVLLKVKKKEIKAGILAIKKQFKVIRQRSRFRIIKDALTGISLLPDSEIKTIISFYYKTTSIRMNKKKLLALASKILRYSNGSHAHLNSAFFTDKQLDKIDKKLTDFVTYGYFDNIDPAQLKKEVLDTSDKIYFLDDNAIKNIYNYFDKQMIENFLSDLNTGEAFIKIWKGYLFPLSEKIDINMFVVGKDTKILDYIHAATCSGLNSSFGFLSKPETPLPNVISKNIDGEAQNAVIYYKIGEFQISSLFLKGYEYFFKKEFTNFKLVRSAINDLNNSNLSTVLQPAGEKIQKSENGYAEIRNILSSIREMDLDQIKTVLKDATCLD